MPYAVISGVPSTCLAVLCDTLLLAGYPANEWSLVSAEPAASADRTPLKASGPLGVQLAKRANLGLGAALEQLGLPAYAARHCAAAVAHGEALLAVHTENGFELESLNDLISECGGRPIAAISSCTARLVA